MYLILKDIKYTKLFKITSYRKENRAIVSWKLYFREEDERLEKITKRCNHFIREPPDTFVPIRWPFSKALVSRKGVDDSSSRAQLSSRG